MKRISIHIFCLSVMAAFLVSCVSEMGMEGERRPVAEGIPGEVELSMLSGDFEKTEIITRASEITTEQHVHSVYIFVVDMKHKDNPARCPVISRQYFYDLTPNVEEVAEGSENFRVNKLKLSTLSCEKARIFAIVNLGYSDVQGVSNDAELLAQCDTLTSLRTLQRLSASLTTIPGEDAGVPEVNVERMQGHHLMSGFFSSLASHDYTTGHDDYLQLESDGKGHIIVRDFLSQEAFRPLGSTGAGIPSAIFAHRLDAKVTVNVEPDGDLKTTPGAYFKLKSWRVMNAPVSENLYWLGEKTEDEIFGCSKTFKRDINPTLTGGYTFTYYQFENYNTRNNFHEITSSDIAKYYNTTYNLTGDAQVTGRTVEMAFFEGEEPVYPNRFTNFAYMMREHEKKVKEDGSDYVPNSPDNDDQEIVVKNIGFEFAPENSTYLLLTGLYYNPQEPVRRRRDTDTHPESFEEFPYLNELQEPVRTKEEAAKRTRSAKVVYRVHLGYVGGGNYEMNHLSNSQQIDEFADFKKKLNDYNVLRNNHYTYNLRVAGVESIKLEATRENGGNIYEQERQPGSEGLVMESRHLYELDSHFETRNLTIDFKRMPDNYDTEFSFGVQTPFDMMRFTMRKKSNGEMGFFRKDGIEVTSIRGHDLDWVHFAWHGTPDEPGRSLIQANGNGIPYSKTYGGYDEQQSYRADYSDLTYPVKDEAHQYRLLNTFEFVHLVWERFCAWKQAGKPEYKRKLHFTFYVDEYYYDFNPVTKVQVDWTEFCNKPRRELVLFMEKEETGADNNSFYADAHLVIYQNAIQTMYATEASHGQIVPDVAFGIEGVDEFRAKYRCNNEKKYGAHQFCGSSKDNGLFNTVQWYKGNSQKPDWMTAERYFNEHARMYVPVGYRLGDSDNERENRRGQWAVYSRNRDLNRNGKLDIDEIRWFVPGVDQYTLCFLGGRPVFDNPIYEKEYAIELNGGNSDALKWLHGIPLSHFMSSTFLPKNSIFWAEEGCSKGDYGQGNLQPIYGIRMARMLTKHGVTNSGAAFEGNQSETRLEQDPLYVVSRSKNGAPVPFEDREDGVNYYIVLNKMNPAAFRDFVAVGELGHHTHEHKQNWLYREYVIARNKVGYKSYRNAEQYDRTVTVNGTPRTWWQVNGVYTDGPDVMYGQDVRQDYRYHGAEYSLAYHYYEDRTGSDLHHWRVPNLREAALMSMSFPEKWFGGSDKSITAGTKSDNLGPESTNIPFWDIRCGSIGRMQSDPFKSGGPHNRSIVLQHVRAIKDVR